MDDNILVYNDPEYGFLPVNSEDVVNADSVRKHFGDELIDEVIDFHGEFIIYKLVPFARISRNLELKIETKDEL